MAEGAIRLQILTPQRLVLETTVESIVARSVAGYLEILKDHAPMAVALDVGILQFGERGDRRKAAIGGGIMHVRKNTVVVLADTAELAAEIDVLRAKEDLQRARRQLETEREERQHRLLRFQVRKAINRLNAAGENRED